MKIMGLCWCYTCSTAMCLTAFTWFKKHQKCLGSLRALCSAWWLKGCESCVISKYIIFPSCFLQSKLDFSPEFVQVTYRTLKGFFFFFFLNAFLAFGLKGERGSTEDEVDEVLLLWREEQRHGLGVWRQINYAILPQMFSLSCNLCVALGTLFLIPYQLFPAWSGCSRSPFLGSAARK